MRVIQFIILAVILGWFFSPVQVTGNNHVMSQAASDSIIAPNVFTPNGDGKNDFFEVRSKEDQMVLLKIYTRAGVLVYSFEAILHAWDGRSLSGEKMANGIYFYSAEVRGSSPKVFKTGFVHLYR